MANRDAILASAEALIAAAVRLLHPLCGEHVSVGIIVQMAEEQAKLASLRAIIEAEPPTQARH